MIYTSLQILLGTLQQCDTWTAWFRRRREL